MVADHDRDLIVQDFEKVIVSDHRSQFGRSIVSDRRSRKCDWTLLWRSTRPMTVAVELFYKKVPLNQLINVKCHIFLRK